VSVIQGVRVRGFGTRDLTWKVGASLDGVDFAKVAKKAGVPGLKPYFDAERAVMRVLDPLEAEIDALEYDEEITSREADRRYKALEARANEEGAWFAIADGTRVVAALREKLGEAHPSANDLRELARLLKIAAKKGTEFRLYSNP
jgi:hypothetical protein